MDKRNSNFFNFVYKIIRFIFLLPINIIKYFCLGFYYINFVWIDIALYTVIFLSYVVYKIVKYLCLSLSLPVMLYNALRRNIKKNEKPSTKNEMGYLNYNENLDTISIDSNNFNDNNVDVKDPIIDIDDILAQEKLENKPFDLLGDGEFDDIDEKFVNLGMENEIGNTEVVEDNEFEDIALDDIVDAENVSDTTDVIELDSPENIMETVVDLPKKVKTPKPNYLAIAVKSLLRWLYLGVLVICLPVYKIFKYFAYGVSAVALTLGKYLSYVSYGVYKIFKYLVFGIVSIILVIKNIFVYVSFGVYKLIKYVVLSLTLPVILWNILKRHRDNNSELREEARLKRQEAKFKKQLQYQKRQEEKLRLAMEKKKKKHEDEYVNENVKLEKKTLGQQFNELLNKLFSFPGEMVSKIKNAYHNSVFAKNSRNQRDMSRQALLIDFEGEDAEKSDVKLVYQYTAKNAEGKIITDYFEAFSKVEVHSFLLSEGYEVYNIKTNKWIQFAHSGSSTSKTKIKNKDLIFFLNQLSTYIKAGITLVESLKILARQYEKQKKYQKLFRTLIYDLSMGDSFSTALSKQGDAFPRILINMVKASEMTGELPEVLDDMAEYFTEMDKTKKQMVTALMYPMIILVIAVVVVTFILLFVIPRFVSIYESMDAAEVPKFTLIVLAVSDFLKNNILYLILGIALTIGVLVYLYKNVKAFRVIAQWVFMHMPVFGNVIIYNEVTTFTKTFASLLSHNVFITDSMEILNKVTNNEIYKMLILDTITNLAKGEKISTSFKDHWAFPVPAYEMLVTGEKTGELPEMMSKVSAYYQELHKEQVTRIKTFVEPALTVFLTVIVGIIILSIIIPMFGMYSTIQSY